MEARKVPVLCVLVLVVLASWSAAPSTARDPFVGLPVGGSGNGVSKALECCNDCRCDPRRSWKCMCMDRSDWDYYCNPGCNDCRCSNRRRPYSCYCADILEYCPDSCGFSSDGSSSTTNTTSSSPSLQS